MNPSKAGAWQRASNTSSPSPGSEIKMRIGTRCLFTNSHPAWNKYIEWLERPRLREVRTLDGMLNGCVRGRSDIECEVDDLGHAIRKLPVPRPGLEYYLLAERCEEHPAGTAIAQFTFLGYDLCDETFTSSLLNCGPWTGPLEVLAERSNSYGLLTWEDARSAKELLPREWGAGEAHAWVDTWALFGSNGWSS